MVEKVSEEAAEQQKLTEDVSEVNKSFSHKSMCPKVFEMKQIEYNVSRNRNRSKET